MSPANWPASNWVASVVSRPRPIEGNLGAYRAAVARGDIAEIPLPAQVVGDGCEYPQQVVGPCRWKVRAAGLVGHGPQQAFRVGHVAESHRIQGNPVSRRVRSQGEGGCVAGRVATVGQEDDRTDFAGLAFHFRQRRQGQRHRVPHAGQAGFEFVRPGDRRRQLCLAGCVGCGESLDEAEPFTRRRAIMEFHNGEMMRRGEVVGGHEIAGGGDHRTHRAAGAHRGRIVEHHRHAQGEIGRRGEKPAGLGEVHRHTVLRDLEILQGDPVGNHRPLRVLES
jgi:hypothetical protein